MTTRSMGRGITLTKEMYKRMGKSASVRAQQHSAPKSQQNIPYASDRIDPRRHVRFS